MNFFIKLITAFLFLGTLGICAAFFLIFDSGPAIMSQGPVSPARFQQTLSFIEVSDPRSLPPGTHTSLTLREDDMNTLVNYILDGSGKGAGKVSVEGEMLTFLGSLKLPSTFFARYVNLQVSLFGREDSLEIGNLKLGKLRLPDFLTRIAAKWLNQELIKRVPEYAEISDAITGYEINGSNLVISYRWQPELLGYLSNHGSGLLIDAEEKEKLTLYTRRLAEITADDELPKNISLTRLFKPVFAFAQSRGEDPVKENRAAILAMALYVMDIELSQIVESAGGAPAIERHNVTLAGRQDFAKHFLTSAAIALSADTNIADSLGLMKEIDDASAGSGFSFTDVGADRAGVRFAEFGTSSSDNAAMLQRKLSGDISEAMFIPNLADLPEFMPEEEFVAKYGGVNQPEFQRVIADIEKRISQLSLFNSP